MARRRAKSNQRSHDARPAKRAVHRPPLRRALVKPWQRSSSSTPRRLAVTLRKICQGTGRYLHRRIEALDSPCQCRWHFASPTGPASRNRKCSHCALAGAQIACPAFEPMVAKSRASAGDREHIKVNTAHVPFSVYSKRQRRPIKPPASELFV